MVVTDGSGIFEMAVTEFDQASTALDPDATQPVAESVRKTRKEDASQKK